MRGRLGRIKVFAGTKRNHREALEKIGQSARALGEDCEIVRKHEYSDCDVAVVWGVPKNVHLPPPPSSKSVEVRKWHLADVFRRHRGVLVILEAPVIGRRVTPKSSRPWWIRKLFPSKAPWTRHVLPKSVYSYDPFSHYRIGVDGMFPDDGGMALAPHCQPRWNKLASRLKLPPLQPYRRTGRHVVVIGQVPGDASLRGADINKWLLQTSARLRTMTDRPIVVRLHPQALDNGPSGIEHRLRDMGVLLDDVSNPLSSTLRDCWAVVTLSSGAAIDALLQGIPAIAMSSASFAWDVSDHQLHCVDNPTLFPREDWLEKIAAAQWTEEELAAGEVWEPLARAIIAARAAPAAP